MKRNHFIFACLVNSTAGARTTLTSKFDSCQSFCTHLLTSSTRHLSLKCRVAICNKEFWVIWSGQSQLITPAKQANCTEKVIQMIKKEHFLVSQNKIVWRRSVRHRTFPTMWPGFSSISFIVRCRYIGQRVSVTPITSKEISAWGICSIIKSGENCLLFLYGYLNWNLENVLPSLEWILPTK